MSPYLIADGAAAAIDFYKSAFGATERMRMPEPDGRVGHAELQIGESMIMLADEHSEMGIHGPKTIGGSPVTLHVYVEDADAAFGRAVNSWRHTAAPDGDPVLWRPLRPIRGPLRP